MDEALAEIARKHLRMDSLETRNSDYHDFYEVHVASVANALRAAYEQGKADASHNS